MTIPWEVGIAVNKQVLKRMMNFQITVHHTVSTTSLGDKVSKEFNVMGYYRENIQMVLNRLGRQETSGAQIYLTGEDVIKIDSDDLIDIAVPVDEPRKKAAEVNPEVELPSAPAFKKIFLNRPILRKDVFYKPNAKVDVGVLYLP